MSADALLTRFHKQRREWQSVRKSKSMSVFAFKACLSEIIWTVIRKGFWLKSSSAVFPLPFTYPGYAGRRPAHGFVSFGPFFHHGGDALATRGRRRCNHESMRKSRCSFESFGWPRKEELTQPLRGGDALDSSSWRHQRRPSESVIELERCLAVIAKIYKRKSARGTLSWFAVF